MEDSCPDHVHLSAGASGCGVLRAVARAVLALMFVGAGTAHFLRSESFKQIVPPGLPMPDALVAISGVAEIVGGVGLMFRTSRRAAGMGLIVLLLAVFPANIYMALRAERFANVAPAWALWARLPLQGVLIAWVWWVGMARPKRK